MFKEVKRAKWILFAEGKKALAYKSFDFALLHTADVLPLHRMRVLQLSEAFTRWLYETDTSAYRAPLDPFRVEFVSPEAIERITARKEYPVWGNIKQDFGTVQGGNWDKPETEEFTSERRAREAAAEGHTPS